MERHGNALTLNGEKVLKIDKTIEGESFEGYYKDLAIDYAFPVVRRSHSDEIYLILPKYYYDHFSCNRLVVPENQFVKCWGMQPRHNAPSGWICDLYILMAKRNDMFCSVRPYSHVLYVVLSDQVLVVKASTSEVLAERVSIIREFQESGQAAYLYDQNFGNQKWRDVSQNFEPR
ncbi:MAG: hypothetical protein K6F57_01225 [Candidatus Saccharibacteria bacterium]|nr:hypothetical protein [Candidatus Saccharibacteria bacterium]